MAQVSPYGRTQRSSLRCWHALILIGLSSWHGLTPPSGEGEERSRLLCPVRALRAYVQTTADMRQSEQLFVSYGGPRRGCALSKQRLSTWIVDVIAQAYKANDCPLPPRVKCHFTRSVSMSWATWRGVPLEDICAAATWASPSTFARYYRVNVADPQPLGVVLQSPPRPSL